MNTLENNDDFFLTEEYYLALPFEVKEIIDQSIGDLDYQLCCKQIEQLRSIGWDGDFGLDGELSHVWKLKN